MEHWLARFFLNGNHCRHTSATRPNDEPTFSGFCPDTAGQKGTGKWTSVNALDMGVPAPTIAEAVFARCLSALKEERVHASKILSSVSGPAGSAIEDKRHLSKRFMTPYIVQNLFYAQGFQLMREANKEYGWDLNFGAIAEIFRGGCIIRALSSENY